VDRFTTIDLDVTGECNLACTYCYRRSWATAGLGGHMRRETAARAVRWFIRQAPKSRLGINFMGAEPLCALDVIEFVMEYSSKRAAARGIEIVFSGSTNCTLIDERVLALVKRGLKLNLSLDGTPEAHDKCRVFADGSGSSRAAFEGASKYLSVTPGEARMTVSPETAALMADGVAHLRTMVSEIAIDADLGAKWTGAKLKSLAAAWRSAADHYILAMSQGAPFYLSPLEKGIRAWLKRRRPDEQCGAARQYAGIALDGGIYPCHRFTGQEAFRLGDVRDGVDESKLAAWRTYRARYDARPVVGDCTSCPAVITCKGGCPAANHTATGDVRSPSPVSCEIRKIVAREALRAVYILTHDDDAAPIFGEYISGRLKPAAPSIGCC